MAILTTVKKSESGFSGVLIAENVYIKVADISGNKNQMSFSVAGAIGDVQVFSAAYTFTPDLNGENFIAQAYTHLKTLPEYADAVDC